MKQLWHSFRFGLLVVSALIASGCATQPSGNANSVTTVASPTSTLPSPSPSPKTETKTVAVTLPVLDALFADEEFKGELKSKLQLSDAQINSLRTIASGEVDRLRHANAEQEGGSAAAIARDNAAESVRAAIGQQKSEDLFTLAREHWLKGSEELEAGKETKPDSMPLLPNEVPKDTRIVVNIPGYRMDVFKDGSLVKSYKIGIGYPEFPLPQGLRKVQSIIFNPTWTPPDEPWVAKMKDVTVGEKVEAGSKLNPLGPIKIPIGMPSLIHGGKSPAKLGGFASHGCVGLTTPQVKDFTKVLAQVAGSEISDQTIQAYLKDTTKTKVVKLGHNVPVELRYETIVAEDGKLHIYRDVYDQDTNTEENLRAVLEANGSRLEDLSADERTQVMTALNAMSAHPQKVPIPRPSEINANTNSNDNAPARKKNEPAKKIAKNQKEIVVEISSLAGKGYPAPVNLDTGTGKPPAAVAVRRNP